MCRGCFRTVLVVMKLVLPLTMVKKYPQIAGQYQLEASYDGKLRKMKTTKMDGLYHSTFELQILPFHYFVVSE